MTRNDCINCNEKQAQKSRVVTWASVFYWISVAVLTATSMHCVLCASICNIYAPGLALRGPTGSMVRAVEGMVDEQVHIMRAFLWSIMSFASSTVMFCWMTMTVDAGISSHSIEKFAPPLSTNHFDAFSVFLPQQLDVP